MRIIYLFLIVFNICNALTAQTSSLSDQLKGYLKPFNAKVGVAVKLFGTNDTLTLYGNDKFAMQSVYKYPLAVAVLKKVDEGVFSLNQMVKVAPSSLKKNTWSPLREKYPKGNVQLPLSTLIEYAVSMSDNNACDILFKLLGGPKASGKILQSLGISGINMAFTEAEMHKKHSTQYDNWGKPSGLLNLLERHHAGKLLSPESNAYLMKVMESTMTGQKRLKYLLPEGTIVAHKTGSSFTDKEGLTAATNDIGIITLPDGQKLGIVVLVGDSKEPDDVRESIIANVAKLCWDYFSGQR